MDQALALAVGTLTFPMVLLFVFGIVVAPALVAAGLLVGGTARAARAEVLPGTSPMPSPRSILPLLLLLVLPLSLRAAGWISPATAE